MRIFAPKCPRDIVASGISPQEALVLQTTQNSCLENPKMTSKMTPNA